MVTTPDVRPPLPYFRAAPTPPDPDPALLTRDILTTAELAALFVPLARDYRAAIVLSVGLGYRDRAGVLRQRLEAYSNALAGALGDAGESASALLRDLRSCGVRR